MSAPRARQLRRRLVLARRRARIAEDALVELLAFVEAEFDTGTPTGAFPVWVDGVKVNGYAWRSYFTTRPAQELAERLWRRHVDHELRRHRTAA